jgi:hypothetical protein
MQEVRESLRRVGHELVAEGRLPLMRLAQYRQAYLGDRQEMPRVLLVGQRILRTHLRGLLMRRSAALKTIKPGETAFLPGFSFW